MKNISVLVSGGGTNLQAVIDSIESGKIPDAKIVQVISSKKGRLRADACRQSRHRGRIYRKRKLSADGRTERRRLSALSMRKKTDLVILAGYMSVLEPKLIEAYRNRIINIHPSLIPKYCGKGFYGHYVHEAVLAGGEKESGATVHFVDEGVDTGKIILQKSVPVMEDDTPDTLAARVLEVEHEILPQAVCMFCEGKL